MGSPSKRDITKKPLSHEKLKKNAFHYKLFRELLLGCENFHTLKLALKYCSKLMRVFRISSKP